MKKTLKIAGIVLLVVLVLGVAALLFIGGPVIKGAVNTMGPQALGVPVTLQGATFRPFRGLVHLRKLHVGNPEGFSTPGLFELGDVEIELDPASLFSDTIVIRRVYVNAPEITYERGLLGSNISRLTKQLEGDQKDPKTKKPDTKGDSGRKVIIEQLIVRDPKLNVSLTAARGHYVPVALGQIELRDIGKDKGGVTIADATRIVFSVITSNIEGAVAGAGDLVASGAKAVGAGAVSAAKGIGSLVGLGGGDSTPATNAPDQPPAPPARE
jgi:uncharacterized protein involved in outer membrane biogenesis